MPTHLGSLAVEITDPESAKFTAELMLVHGLWTRPTGWRRYASYLAHRGWRCIAVAFDTVDPALDVRARAGALRAAIAALAAPPVLLGHDLGAQVALQCADAARALVALAPLVGPPLVDLSAALGHGGGWLSRRRGGAVRAPRGRWQAAYPEASVREPAALLDAVRAGMPLPSVPGDLPAAVFSGEDDPLLDVARARTFAEQIGAELHVLPGAGHAVLDGPGWESSAAAIHRWIVQRLGVDLLALYDEAWEGREKP